MQVKIVDKITMIHMAVRDMDKAKEFYTDKLGFEATGDYEQGGGRWVPLALPSGGASIVLTTYLENLQPGTMKLYLSTPNVELAYEELKGKGVAPIGDVESDQYGKRFSIKDPDGNSLVIQQG
jgi:catechol 2,3-dioxygenase-like lactoylglutathione lyase family enzyme